MPSIEQGVTLLRLARAAIARELGFISHDPNPEEWLLEKGATFVTLTLHDRLRGCIGSLEAYRPLIEDVRNNAVSAAFEFQCAVDILAVDADGNFLEAPFIRLVPVERIDFPFLPFGKPHIHTV